MILKTQLSGVGTDKRPDWHYSSTIVSRTVTPKGHTASPHYAEIRTRPLSGGKGKTWKLLLPATDE